MGKLLDLICALFSYIDPPRAHYCPVLAASRLAARRIANAFADGPRPRRPLS